MGVSHMPDELPVLSAIQDYCILNSIEIVCSSLTYFFYVEMVAEPINLQEAFDFMHRSRAGNRSPVSEHNLLFRKSDFLYRRVSCVPYRAEQSRDKGRGDLQDPGKLFRVESSHRAGIKTE